MSNLLHFLQTNLHITDYGFEIIWTWITIAIPGILAILALLLTLYWMLWIFGRDEGTADLRQVSDAILDASDGFLRPFIATVSTVIAPCSLLVFSLYLVLPNLRLGEYLSELAVAIFLGITFLLGAIFALGASICSAYMNLRMHTRVASAARRSYAETSSPTGVDPIV